jgi:hypothetical protein
MQCITIIRTWGGNADPGVSFFEYREKWKQDKQQDTTSEERYVLEKQTIT